MVVDGFCDFWECLRKAQVNTVKGKKFCLTHAQGMKLEEIDHE